MSFHEVGEIGDKPPNFLCKFKPINKYTLGIFSDEDIYFSIPGDLNDPMECFIPRPVHIKSSVPYYDERVNYWRMYYEKLINTFGVFSASEFVVENEYLAQWSHYGDQHRGLCIIFEPIVSSVPWLKVKYESLSELPETPVTKNNRDFCYQRLVWKHDNWSHENEWRLVLPQGFGGTKKDYRNFFSISQITFGYRCTWVEILKVIKSFSKNLTEDMHLWLGDEENKHKLELSRVDYCSNTGKAFLKKIHPKEINEILDNDLLPLVDGGLK